jgi:peptide/nickel transport system permease protein
MAITHNKGLFITLALAVIALGAAVTTVAATHVKLVPLWTDDLIYLLLLVIIGFVFYTRSRPHLLIPWRQVGRRPMGVAAMIVLAVYVGVGLLDSVHLQLPLPGDASQEQRQYDPQVLSVLDLVLTRLRKDDEKSYSAPFATHLYVKETVELPGGGVTREYPKLVYGGTGLSDPSRKGRDIAWTTLQGVMEGVAIFIALGLGLLLGLSWRHGTAFKATLHQVLRGHTAAPWRTVLLTVGGMITLTCLAVSLSAKYHVLGTDKVGQDVLYLSLKSIRTGLVIGTLTTLVMLPFAIMLGVFAGYFGRWVDDIIQYIYTTLSSIPGVLLIAAMILITQVYIDSHPDQFGTITLRADARLLSLCVILGITSWTGLCRYLRGESLKLREMDYVQAAQALGVGHLRIIVRHIVPNIMHIVLIVVVIDFSGLVLAEAVLSYVGVGVDPSMISWGNMINSARLELARDPVVWWSLLAAFVFMFTLVLAANLFSDVVRDAFDPRVRQN